MSTCDGRNISQGAFFATGLRNLCHSDHLNFKLAPLQAEQTPVRQLFCRQSLILAERSCIVPILAAAVGDPPLISPLEIIIL